MNELSRERQLESILHAYLQAVDAGQVPDQGELLSQHPEFVEELREFLRTNDDVRAVTDPNVDPITLVKDGTLAKLWSEGKLKPSIFFSGPYKRYVAAHDLVDQYIFKMYVPDEPLKQRPRPGA